MDNRVTVAVALVLPLFVSACGLGVSDRQMAEARHLAQTGPYDTLEPRPTGDPLQVRSIRTWGYQEHLTGVPGNTGE